MQAPQPACMKIDGAGNRRSFCNVTDPTTTQAPEGLIMKGILAWAIGIPIPIIIILYVMDVF